MTYIDDQKTQTFNTSRIRGAMKARMLSRAEETALARAWLSQKDEKALHQLIAAHERLAISVASKFRAYGLPLGDMIQEGMVGLLEAANRFDPERDIRFSTYAIWWIRATIQDYILRNWSIVRIGSTSSQKALFFNLRKLRARINANAGAQASPSDTRREIATQLGVRLKDVEEMETRLSGPDSSLNAPIGTEGDDEWMALLPDNRPNPEDIVIGMRDAKTRSRWLAEALGELSERERTIITRRHLTPKSVTLEDLGITLGVSKERVRQLETRAMEKLKTQLTQNIPDQSVLWAS